MIETDLDEDVNQEMLTLYNIKKNCVVFRLFREIDRRCMQGETKMKRRGCPSGKLLLEVTSPKV